MHFHENVYWCLCCCLLTYRVTVKRACITYYLNEESCVAFDYGRYHTTKLTRFSVYFGCHGYANAPEVVRSAGMSCIL